MRNLHALVISPAYGHELWNVLLWNLNLMSTSTVLLVADDYALTPCISDSILMLAEAGRLSGTSAMVTGPHWPGYAPRLAKLSDRIDAGLHVNLTTGRPLTEMPIVVPAGLFPSMLTMSLKSFLFSSARCEVQAEIVRQIECFRDHYGALPAYLDGHRHIHVLPGIREAFFAAIGQVEPGWRPFIRSVEEPWERIDQRGITPFKTKVISILSRGMRGRARAQGFGVNAGFAGVTDFNPKRHFRTEMQAFLANLAPGSLIMVHPGLGGDHEIATLDAVVATRPLEHDYLISPAFAEDLAAAGWQIGRIAKQG
jgi:chitin disaccharide deacetylase